MSNLENAVKIRNIFAVCKFRKCNDSSQQIFGIIRSMDVSVNAIFNFGIVWVISIVQCGKTHGIHHFGRQHEIRLFKKILGFRLNDVDVV